MATIIADDRENTGANPYFSQFIEIDNRKYSKLYGYINVNISRLTTADYCILLPDKQIAMCIERKTWKDLAASIKDGRMNSQHNNMEEIRASTGCKLLYIIEGALSYKKTTRVNRIPFINLHAKMRHTLLRGTPFIQSRNATHTAELIVDFARDIVKMNINNNINFSIEHLDNKDTQKEYIEQLTILNKKFKSLPLIQEVNQLINSQQIIKSHIDPIIIDSLVEGNKDIELTDIDINLETLINVNLIQSNIDIPAQLTEFKVKKDSDIIINIWQSLPGVSNKTAPILMNAFSLKEFICLPFNEKNKIALLKYPNGIKIGFKRADKITEILYTGTDVIKLAKVKDISIKLLVQIPMITIDTAKIIVNSYSLKDICKGLVDINMIAEMKKNNGRLLGMKAATRVTNIFYYL